MVYKKEIIELSEKNKNAQYICNYFGWLDAEITKEDILKEIVKYLQNQPDKITNFGDISDKLKLTGGKIGNYLDAHKKEIIEISEKNKNAQYICNYFGWLDAEITKEDILKEIVKYLQNQPDKIISFQRIKDRLNLTGGKIGNYLTFHKNGIIEMALNKNEDAIYICDYFKSFQKDLYKRMDEIASNDSHFQKVKESIENKMEVKIAK